MKSPLSRLSLFVVLPLLLGLAGCSTSSSVVTGKPRPAISPDLVKIYRIAPPVYEEVAILEANSKGSASFSDQAKTDVAIERLKEQAAKLGANGVLLNGISDQYGGSFSIGLGSGSYSRNSGTSVGVGTSTATTYKVASGIAIFVIEDFPASTDTSESTEAVEALEPVESPEPQ